MRNSNRGPAFLILFATLMAAAGDGVSIVAFPWLVLQREGSAGQASIVASATMLPLLFATLVAGTAVDYFGRRRVSMVADALSGAAVAGVPLVAWGYGGDAVNVLVLAVLAALAAAFGPAGMTARDSMLPEAAARAGWSLDRINGAYEAILNLAFIVGPAIGGLMIATVGGITTNVDYRDGIRVVHPRDCRPATRGCRQAAPHLAAPRVGIRDRRGAALRLEPAGIAHPRDD